MYQCSSAVAAATGCSEDVWVAALSFFLPGPEETFTVAGLRRRSPRRKPRLNS